LGGIVTNPVNGGHWSAVKVQLETFDRQELVRLIGDLYRASSANRRFLETRLVPDSAGLEVYRRIVASAIYPDPFSKRPISIRDAAAAIVEYKRSTGDLAGTVDLMLIFVEAGTEQAVDLGYGDDAYFNALVSRLKAVAKGFDDLPEAVRSNTITRLERIRSRAKHIGWGYGDVVDDIVTTLERRRAPSTRSRGGQR
jgi:hypothetical protein